MRQILLLFVFLCSINFVLAVAPTLTEIPTPQNLTEGVAYSYDVNATDPEMGTLYFSDDTSNFNINSETGVISFTPSNAMVGSFLAVIIVRDEEDLVDAQVVNFTINGLPSISSLTDKTVQAGNEFYFDVNATDPEDGTNVNFFDNSSLFVINQTTGIINFTTSLPQNGSYSINITVNDSLGAQSSATFTLVINDPIVMGDLPANQTIEDVLFNFNVSLYVNNSIGTLTYSDNTSFFDIISFTGLITFTPTQSMVGNHSFNISVQDDYGYNTSKIWYLNITEINDPPNFTSIPDQEVMEPTGFVYDINATDEENQTLTYYDNTTLFDIDSSTGLINRTTNISLVGRYYINITVNDSSNGTFSDDFILDISTNHVPIYPKNYTLNTSASMDNYVDSQFNTTNYQGSEYLRLADLTTSIKRIYLNFSFSSIPSYAVILNSYINLSTYSGTYTGNNISLYRVTENWTEDTSTYNSQPSINSTAIVTVSPSGGGNIDKFDTTDLFKNWLNGSYNNSGVSLRYYNESMGTGTISYYSSESSNSSQWPTLHVDYNLSIQNQSLTAGVTSNNLFDLDDYFYDPDGDEMNYTYISNTSSINITINSTTHNVSIYPSSTFNGSAYVIFYANDSENITNSHNVTINVTIVEEEDNETTTVVSSSGGGGGSRQKVASLSVTLDSSRESILQGKTLEVPVTVKNTGQVDIYSIELSTSSDKEGLNVVLDKTAISFLKIGQEDYLTMLLDSASAAGDSYVITLSASSDSPEVEGSAVFILDVSSEAEGIKKQLVFAQDLFQTNPECLELQELLNKAEDQLAEQKFEEAKNNVAMAIESCKNLIRIQESPKEVKKTESNLQQILIISGIFTAILLMGYLVVRKIAYKPE